MATQIFQIQVKHGYYKSGLPPALRFRFRPETQRFMDRAGVFAREIPGGLVVLVDIKGDPARFVRQLLDVNPDLAFSFGFEVVEPRFASITECPPDRLCRFAYRGGGSSEADGAVQLQGELEDQDSAAPQEQGRVELGQDDLLNEDLSFRRPRFEIQLPARRTRRRYWIFNRSQARLTDPLVSDGSGNVFDGPVRTPMALGQEALVFSSGERTYALSEATSERFSLSDRIERPGASPAPAGRPNPYPVIADLPAGDVSCIRFAPDSNPPQSVSEIYVYL